VPFGEVQRHFCLSTLVLFQLIGFCKLYFSEHQRRRHAERNTSRTYVIFNCGNFVKLSVHLRNSFDRRHYVTWDVRSKVTYKKRVVFLFSIIQVY